MSTVSVLPARLAPYTPRNEALFGVDLMRTAEACRIGHPDRVCDLMADALLDAYLLRDSFARVALEVQGGHGAVCVTGEATSRALLNEEAIRDIVQRTYEGIGYAEELRVTANIVQQSAEISFGVDAGGAGDSGIVSGFACDETEEMLPREFAFARRIVQAFDALRPGEGFGSDGKVQVTLDDRGRAAMVVVSAQHILPLSAARKRMNEIVRAALGDVIAPDGIFHLNPAGSFTVGGFAADTGASGRKIVQDQYGPNVPVGGGAFSGKDATKVDRSGAYFARHAAVSLVRNGCRRAFVQLAFAIGLPKPVWINLETDPPEAARNAPSLDVTVAEMIAQLDLRKPAFYERAKRGHFGFNGL